MAFVVGWSLSRFHTFIALFNCWCSGRSFISVLHLILFTHHRYRRIRPACFHSLFARLIDTLTLTCSSVGVP